MSKGEGASSTSSSSSSSVEPTATNESSNPPTLLPLADRESSVGIRAAEGWPVSCLHDATTSTRTDDELIADLLHLIRGHFASAYDFLTAGGQRRIELVPCLYTAGHCIGLLDPRSNIIVNTVLHQRRHQTRRDAAYWKDEDEATVHSYADEAYWEVPATQSVEGLATFLRRHFRYLTFSQALRYLYLARCDAVLAIGLVQADRQIDRRGQVSMDTGETSATALASLQCAALAAYHPYPDEVYKFAARRFGFQTAEKIHDMIGEASISSESFGRPGHPPRNYRSSSEPPAPDSLRLAARTV